MYRRNILWGALSALGMAFTASPAAAASEAEPPGKLKVVYHLADLDRVHFVLGNIQNHLDGVGGPDHVTLALVVHGPALRAFHAESANWDIAHRIGQFSKIGMELVACGNNRRTSRCGICCRASSAPTRAAWCGWPNYRRKGISISGLRARSAMRCAVDGFPSQQMRQMRNASAWRSCLINKYQ